MNIHKLDFGVKEKEGHHRCVPNLTINMDVEGIIEKKSEKDIEQQFELDDNGIHPIYLHHTINENNSDAEKKEGCYNTIDFVHHILLLSKKLKALNRVKEKENKVSNV